MRKVVIGSAASEAASVLREEILRNLQDDEWLIGSEDDVMRQLGVSRPTLRQALRMLEQEQIIRVKRGVGGGLFGRRPSGSGVSHAASVYLRAEGTTYGDLMHSLILLTVHCARLAAQHPDAARRASLLTFYQDRTDGDPSDLSGEEFARLAGGFLVELPRLIESPTLEMFVSVLVELARPAAGSALYTPERIAVILERHFGVAEAIASGRPEAAAKRLRVHFDHALEWSDEATPLGSLYPSHPAPPVVRAVGGERNEGRGR